MKRSRLAVLAAIALMVAACGTAEEQGPSTSAANVEAEAEEITVVATTTMLGDVVANVIGEGAALEILIPVGADPHDFQASSQQVSLLNTADLVVANGLGLEEGLHDVLEGAESDGAHVLEVAPMLAPIPFGGHNHEGGDHEDSTKVCDPDLVHDHEDADHDHEDADHDHEDADHDHEDADHDHEDADHDHEDSDHDHEPGSCDPHVWMDPIRMAEAANRIAAELEEIAPGGGWNERAEAYAEALISASDEIVDTLSAIPEGSRVLVTNHEAFGYFAYAYDFEIVGVVIPGGSTLGEPSSSELADLVGVIDEEGVTAIFVDSSSPSGLAEAVAEEAAGEVAVVEVYSESLGDPGSGADTLIGMLTTNAQRIADSLS